MKCIAFWLLTDDYYEQPIVSYTKKYAIECIDIKNTYFYTNIESIASLNKYAVKPNTVASITDTN
jgi:hypothetical protein